MRSDDEVRAQLLDWARESERIRAMWLTGSRADSTRTPDDLSDYDVGVLVQDRTTFLEDSWVARFGPVMVRWPRRPSPTYSEKWVTQLVLFDDEVRIDFQITDSELDFDGLRHDGYRLLIDKEGLFRSNSRDCDPSFTIAPPTEEQFLDLVNAFFWDIVYVPKALLRDELNFAKYMLDGGIRFDALETLIEWYIGVTVEWKVDTGIHGRWFARYLPAELWTRYEATFATAGSRENWEALLTTVDFVRLLATEVAARLSFAYPSDTDAKVSRYIRRLHDRAIHSS